MVIASNAKAPMTLRVNANRYSRADYLNKLQDQDIAAQILAHSQTAIQLEHPCNVFDLPDFSQGAVSVQDAAAQYAAQLLNCQSGMRVLDACAAPGGKTGHILETAEQLKVIAVDNKIHRLNKVKENLYTACTMRQNAFVPMWLRSHRGGIKTPLIVSYWMRLVLPQA